MAGRREKKGGWGEGPEREKAQLVETRAIDGRLHMVFVTGGTKEIDRHTTRFGTWV